MLTLLLIWTIGILAMLTLFIAAVRGWIMNLFFALALIIDAFKDIACQLWIDVRGIWKKEDQVNLYEHEQRLS